MWHAALTERRVCKLRLDPRSRTASVEIEVELKLTGRCFVVHSARLAADSTPSERTPQ